MINISILLELLEDYCRGELTLSDMNEFKEILIDLLDEIERLIDRHYMM